MMKFPNFTRIPANAMMIRLHSIKLPPSPQSSCNNVEQRGDDFIAKLLDRRWSLSSPDAKIHKIKVLKRQVRDSGGRLGDIEFVNETHPSLGYAMANMGNEKPCFYIVRDDLLHPLVNGNKARKLDGLLPLIEDHDITDVVTCGGCQSAHVVAVAVSCAERGVRSHLLLRGEQPEILTGYNLISTMHGNVSYVPRSIYAKREEMLRKHADMVAGTDGSIVLLDDILESSFSTPGLRKLEIEKVDAHNHLEECPKRIVIVSEGAGDSVAFLGVIRLVHFLSRDHNLGTQVPVNVVVDAGTGTTAVGLGLAVVFLGLPWKVTAVMLADSIDGYKNQEKRLITEFKGYYASYLDDDHLKRLDGRVIHWVERGRPRRFGNIMEGELEDCQRIAQQTGVSVDPIYTLGAWEMATFLSQEEGSDGSKVVMLHTGGTLGMFGLAQRYKSYFGALKGYKST